VTREEVDIQISRLEDVINLIEVLPCLHGFHVEKYVTDWFDQID